MPVIVALAASGVAISFVGILQRLSNNGKVLWQYELLGGGSPFGPFVNANNAAGFLLIGFSAAMFFVSQKLILWKSDNTPEQLSLDGTGWESSDRRSIFSGLIEAVARMESQHLYFLAALTIIVAGVCASRFARWHGGTGLLRNARLFLNYQEQSAGGNYINVGNSRWRNWAR